MRSKTVTSTIMVPTDLQLKSLADQMHDLDSRHACGVAVKDLFAVGCWLHATGERDAGLKAVDTALKAINLDRENKSLFLAIVDRLAGNEFRFAKAIEAHHEINALIEAT